MNESCAMSEQEWKAMAREHLHSHEAQRLERVAMGIADDPGADLGAVLDIAMLVPLCFGPFNSCITAIQDAIQRVLTQVLQPAFEEVERDPKLSPEAFEDLQVLLTGESALWAIFCLGAGLELGLHNLVEAEAQGLIESASELYGHRASQIVQPLAERGLLTEPEAAAHKAAMRTTIQEIGHGVMELGMEMCEVLDRTSDEFFRAVKARLVSAPPAENHVEDAGITPVADGQGGTMKQERDPERAEWEARAIPTLRARQALWRQDDLAASPAGRVACIEDVLDLGLHVPLSYDPFASPWKMIQDVVDTVREEVIRPVMGECVKAGLVKEQEIDDTLMRAITALKGWALACLGLGLERGFGTLSRDRGNECLARVSLIYAHFAVESLVPLTEGDFLSEVEANAHLAVMLRTIAGCGSQAAGLGFEERSSLQRRDDRFLKAVERFSALREE